mgnify:CR=1 FL=1
MLRSSRGFFPWFGVNGDNRRKIVPSMWVNLGYNDEGRSRNVRLNPSINMQISTGLQANIGAALTHNENATQWYGNFADDGGTHYSFAHLDQRTLSMNLRVNYTASRDLTFELYAEPFVSKGTYSDVRELSDSPSSSTVPKTSSFSGRSSTMVSAPPSIMRAA